MEKQLDSYTFTLKDLNGFDGLYTLRQTEKETGSQFLERIKSTSNKLPIEGFTPKLKEAKFEHKNAETIKPAIAEKCKKCGSDMKPGKNGKPYCLSCYLEWKKDNIKTY